MKLLYRKVNLAEQWPDLSLHAKDIKVEPGKSHTRRRRNIEAILWSLRGNHAPRKFGGNPSALMYYKTTNHNVTPGNRRNPLCTPPHTKATYVVTVILQQYQSLPKSRIHGNIIIAAWYGLSVEKPSLRGFCYTETLPNKSFATKTMNFVWHKAREKLFCECSLYDNKNKATMNCFVVSRPPT